MVHSSLIVNKNFNAVTGPQEAIALVIHRL